MPLLNCPFKAQLDIVSYGRACPSQHYVLFGRACPSLINALPNIISCFGKGMPITMPFHISMPFHALRNPNMIWQSIDFTHTVSEVPCVVEQRALVLFYEGRSAVTTVANFWELSLKVNISYSWIDLRF